jgi:hypothetical protein
MALTPHSTGNINAAWLEMKEEEEEKKEIVPCP